MIEPLIGLVDETVALFHRMRESAERIHGQGELSAGRRGVLHGLARLGPQTVPQMARARPVSRQHIQTIVNALAPDGLVESTPNPAHKRSALIRLTPKGRALVDTMNRREASVLPKVARGFSRAELEQAASVLRRVREALERLEARK